MKFQIFVFACFGLAMTSAIPSSKPTDVLTGNIEFLYGDYVVFWEINEQRTHITLDVTVRNQGWFGIGFSESGNMENADMHVAQVVTTDGVKSLDLKDYHSITSSNTPMLDAVQNLQVSQSGRNGTHSFVRFSRAIETGDVTEDMIIPLDGVYMIWAFSESVETMEFHRDNAGQGRVVFEDGDDEVDDDDEEDDEDDEEEEE